MAQGIQNLPRHNIKTAAAHHLKYVLLISVVFFKRAVSCDTFTPECGSPLKNAFSISSRVFKSFHKAFRFEKSERVRSGQSVWWLGKVLTVRRHYTLRRPCSMWPSVVVEEAALSGSTLTCCSRCGSLTFVAEQRRRRPYLCIPHHEHSTRCTSQFLGLVVAFRKVFCPVLSIQ